MQVDTYRIEFKHYPNPGHEEGRVVCYSADRSEILAVHFYKDFEYGQPWENSKVPVGATGNVIYHLHMDRSLMSGVVDLLRNEKPVYFNFFERAPIYSALSSGQEVVGEGEI